MSSASGCWRPPTTRTRSPSLYCGLILRAPGVASVTVGLGSARPGDERHAAVAAEALLGGVRRPQAGQTRLSSTSSSTSSTRPSSMRYERTLGRVAGAGRR